MAQGVRTDPDGSHTLTSGLVVKDGHRAIEFQRKAFGTEGIFRMPGMCQTPETLKGIAQVVYMHFQDVEVAFNCAVAASTRVVMPLSDMFWGDRFGKLADSFGREWALASNREDLPGGAMGKRSKAFLEQMGKR